MLGVSLVFSVFVDVCLRKGIADPAGSTIERSLPTLGFSNVRDVTAHSFAECLVMRYRIASGG